MKRMLSATLLAIALTWMPPVPASRADEPLDTLFRQLKETTDENAAQRIEEQIRAALTAYPGTNKDVDPLMGLGNEALAKRDARAALAIFDRVLEIAPEFAEAWNRRAAANYLAGDPAGAIRDIQTTLTLEPRHFGALNGLGMILMAGGRDAAALRAFEAALAINPHLKSAKRLVEELRRKVTGEPS